MQQGYIPEQGPTLHSIDSVASPTQAAPPRLGDGSVQVLVRVWTPLAHDAEQEPQADHWLQPPSTGSVKVGDY